MDPIAMGEPLTRNIFDEQRQVYHQMHIDELRVHNDADPRISVRRHNVLGIPTASWNLGYFRGVGGMMTLLPACTYQRTLKLGCRLAMIERDYYTSDYETGLKVFEDECRKSK